VRQAKVEGALDEAKEWTAEARQEVKSAVSDTKSDVKSGGKDAANDVVCAPGSAGLHWSKLRTDQECVSWSSILFNILFHCWPTYSDALSVIWIDLLYKFTLVQRCGSIKVSPFDGWSMLSISLRWGMCYKHPLSNLWGALPDTTFPASNKICAHADLVAGCNLLCHHCLQESAADDVKTKVRRLMLVIVLAHRISYIIAVAITACTTAWTSIHTTKLFQVDGRLVCVISPGQHVMSGSLTWHTPHFILVNFAALAILRGHLCVVHISSPNTRLIT
jgi:hypothetical protein